MRIFWFFFLWATTLCGMQYQKPAEASEGAWMAVQEYLLPFGHRVRGELDEIFRGARVTANKDTLRAAGFALTPDQGLHVFVASHPRLKGFLVKVILDKDTPNTDGKGMDWEHWIARINGERIIRQGINDLGYKKYFKVPRQWIYPLSEGPEAVEREGYTPKAFILVVEDMKLEPKKVNTELYREISTSRLKAIFRMATNFGLSDCCNKHNVPWCKDGKMAFVDTETFGRWPVDYHRMVEFLSPKGRMYWKKLRAQGGSK